jgi:Holliday junction resolvasome RuvABC endonuclease subunit
MLVVGIDVGLRSLGWASFDSNLGDCTSAAAWQIGIVDLWSMVSKKDKNDYCLLAKRMLEAMPQLRKADVVVIERQMQARMKQVATALRAFLWPRAQLVTPLAVKRFFGTSTGHYKLNKKAGVELSREICPLPIRNAMMEMKAKQETDVADALLMCYWYCFAKLQQKMPKHIVESRRIRGVKVKRSIRDKE